MGHDSNNNITHKKKYILRLLFFPNDTDEKWSLAEDYTTLRVYIRTPTRYRNTYLYIYYNICIRREILLYESQPSRDNE
jgi:hypothetical protein